MSPRALRWISAFDVLGITLAVWWFIWRWQFTEPETWVIFPIWLLGSFLLHRDTPKTLGWRADNFWPAFRQAAAILAVFAVLVLAAGFALGAPRQPVRHFSSLGHLWNYFAFCLLQQVALQSLVNNRLIEVTPNRGLSSLLAGTIFGLLHWPNPVLVPATFVAGSAMAWLFARERNVIPLAIWQTILGALAAWAFPFAWTHAMRVGPGFYRPW